MSRKTVGAISSYNNLGSFPADWLWKQTPHPFGVWGNIQMQGRSKHPDFLLLYNFNVPKPPRKLTLREKLGLRQSPVDRIRENWQKLPNLPPERIIYLLREPPLEEVVDRHKAAYENAKPYCGYISGPDDFAPNPDYMPAIWYASDSFRELDEMPPPMKQKPCSWISSGVNRTEKHRQRLAFMKQLKESGVDVDLYGRNLPDWSGSLGALANKSYAMNPYRYNLAIENYADNDWYVSEKMWDALLSWCLPIYYGGPAADKLLPPGSFLRLPSLDEKGIAYIREVTATPDAWYEAKDAIAEARQIVLHKLNLLNWLSEFVDRF